LSVVGVAASIIADHAPKDDAITVTCEGPRTRVYCIYDDDAVEGSEASEGPLGYDALSGDWRVSLPCHEDDLGWVQGALTIHSKRITARKLGDAIADDGNSKEASGAAQPLVLDPKGFLAP
jgi:hypothetical protein